MIDNDLPASERQKPIKSNWLGVPNFSVPQEMLGAIGRDFAQQPADEEAIYLFLKSALAQAIVIGHWSTGRIIYATGAAAALLGVRADLLPGMSALQFFANPEDRLAAMGRLARGENPVRAELRLRSFDGRDLCVLADLGRIVYQREPSLILVLNDVTHYKNEESRLNEDRARLNQEAQELLRQSDDWRERHEAARAANEAKSQFLARMSHDLRSPLNAILGFAEIIRDESLGAALRDRYREYAGDIHRAGTHLLALINDILDLSKIEAGRMEFEREPVDLAELAAECHTMMRPEAQRRHIDLLAATNSGPRPPIALADRKRCRQIAINLLSNALKFTPPGGKVTMETEALSDGRVAIAVCDTGIGMTAAQIAVALEPFGQISGAIDTQIDADRGTGLGLPIVKSLIEAQGGDMTIISQPGTGTRVRLRLPSVMEK